MSDLLHSLAELAWSIMAVGATVAIWSIEREVRMQRHQTEAILTTLIQLRDAQRAMKGGQDE